MIVNTEDLARNYFNDEVSLDSRGTTDTTQSWEVMESLIDTEPRAAWNVIKSALQLCSSSIEVARIGSGPLETLLSRHAETIFVEVLKEARVDSTVRDAVRYATAAELPNDMQVQLDALLR